MSYKLLKSNNFDAIFSFSEENLLENIVIDISQTRLVNNEIKSLSKIITNKKKNGTSFVLIMDCVDLDKIPEEINIVPTLQEAIDLIEMEEMMRDLE